jgi:hypothetical protein
VLVSSHHFAFLCNSSERENLAFYWSQEHTSSTTIIMISEVISISFFHGAKHAFGFPKMLEENFVNFVGDISGAHFFFKVLANVIAQDYGYSF